MNTFQPSPPVDADGPGGIRGFLNSIAQTISGVKTFASVIVASAGIQIASVLWNTNGTGASDTVIKVGTSQPDASVNAAAKIFSVVTGYGGTEITRAYFTKDTMVWPVNAWTVEYGSGTLFWKTGSTALLALLNGSGVLRSGYGFDLNPAFGAFLTWQVQSSGIVNQAGTDSSGTPGSRTGANAINKPTGKSAIASGQTTCQIGNSLVSAGDQVFITWHGDLGAQSKIPWVSTAAGSFTVNVGTAPASNVAFCWWVQKRL